jgi:hypothetical protein
MAQDLRMHNMVRRHYLDALAAYMHEEDPTMKEIRRGQYLRAADRYLDLHLAHEVDRGQTKDVG